MTVERRSTCRENCGSVAVCNDDRGCTMWKYDNDCENVEKKSNTAVQKEDRISLWTVARDLEVTRPLSQ